MVKKERTEGFFKSYKHRFAPGFVNTVLIQHLLDTPDLITRYDDRQYLHRGGSVFFFFCWIEAMDLVFGLAQLMFILFLFLY